MNLSSQHFTVVEDTFYDHRFWVVDDSGEQWVMGPGLDSAAEGAALLIVKAGAGEATVPPVVAANPRLVDPKPLSSLLGARVRVYWNVTKKVWSIQYRQQRLRKNGGTHYQWVVAGHAQGVGLKGVHFEVSAAGRERVRASGRKEVHAYASGVLAATVANAFQDNGLYDRIAMGCGQRVGYNPKTSRGACFTTPEGETVAQAGYALLNPAGHVFVDAKTS